MVARSQEQLQAGRPRACSARPRTPGRARRWRRPSATWTRPTVAVGGGEAAAARQPVVRPLATALEAEQRAYAALLRLRDREHNVTRGRRRRGRRRRGRAAGAGRPGAQAEGEPLRDPARGGRRPARRRGPIARR